MFPPETCGSESSFTRITAASDPGHVLTIAIPDQLNVVAEYSVGVLARSERRALAQAFVEWALGPEGQAILRSHGFGP